MVRALGEIVIETFSREPCVEQQWVQGDRNHRSCCQWHWGPGGGHRDSRARQRHGHCAGKKASKSATCYPDSIQVDAYSVDFEGVFFGENRLLSWNECCQPGLAWDPWIQDYQLSCGCWSSVFKHRTKIHGLSNLDWIQEIEAVYSVTSPFCGVMLWTTTNPNFHAPHPSCCSDII